MTKEKRETKITETRYKLAKAIAYRDYYERLSRTDLLKQHARRSKQLTKALRLHEKAYARCDNGQQKRG